mmetsp:Transcript_77254/g.196196  ORF Transcript_77254/g.196196 Transcript_77254/m.196196 type:complete len:210 (+) Transcript_77254:528-1157(+)
MHRRYQPTSSRTAGRRFVSDEVTIFNLLADVPQLALPWQRLGQLPIVVAKPMALLRRNPKCRVDHAKRLEDALLQKLAKRHSADGFHQHAADVGVVAIVPSTAGLEQQRHLHQFLHELLHGTIRIEFDASRFVHGVHRVPCDVEAVGQASGVRQHMQDSDGVLARLRLHVAIFREATLPHAHLLLFPRLTQVQPDRIRQEELALLIQHH